jgi:hypothetical protein
MLQKFLDGKKKYSALILTLAATIVPVLIQDTEAQATILDAIPSIASLIVGVFYIVTQGKIDQEKEKTAGSALTTLTNGFVPPAQQTQAAATQTTGAAVLQAPVETAPPFDVKAFHETVIAEVQAAYKETNPATIYYKARDKGQVTQCRGISQVTEYWNYLTELATDARDWLRVQTEKKAGTCGRSPEYYVFTRDFNTTMRAAAWLTELQNSGVDWKTKLMPFQRTLYMVGILAEQLM